MVRRFLLLSMLFLGLSTFAFATDYPMSITDSLGRVVTLEAAPQRVISMLPSHTETVCALGACDRLVGVDEFSNYPPQVLDLPHLGSAYSANIEAIVALQPDLVLTDASSELAVALSRLGIVTFAGMAKDYEDVFDDFAALGTLLDLEAEASRISASLRSAVEEVAVATRDLPRPTVFLELDATPYSAGPESYIGELVKRAGGANILDPALGLYPQVDPEAIVAADPEVIVLLDAPYGESAATVAARPGWQELRAIVNERVIAPTPEQVDMLSRPGPRLAEAVALLAQWFHPAID